MARKQIVESQAGLLGKVFGATFNALLAPLAVAILSQTLLKDKSAPPAPVQGRAATERVVVEGIGRTPQEALHNGLCVAVRAIADGLAREGDSGSLSEAVLARSETFVPHWEEIGGRIEARPGQETCHRKLAVVVDRQALATQLKASSAHAVASGSRHDHILD